MDSNDFVSVNSVVSDVLIHCNDETLINYGLNKGFYISSIQKALEELSIDTYYNTKTIDVPMDKTKLAIKIPDNIFNIREIYGFVGDCCDNNNSFLIHWKRLFNNKGNGKAHTSARKANGNRDPFFPKDNYITDSLYYANSQNGMLMFSSNCSKFDSIRLVANTMGVRIGDEPIIPRIFRQAITDFVIEKTMSILSVRDRTFRTLAVDARARLSESWYKAERRAKTLDTWKKSDMREYLGRINY